MASNELVLAQDHILLLGRKSAQEKVASFLLSLSDRAIKRKGMASPISMPMSREDIADYLGLATETVSRTITIMKRDGFIRLLQGGKIEISDLEALKEFAESS
jgi:CRP/FNR family transcriptional regulator